MRHGLCARGAGPAPDGGGGDFGARNCDTIRGSKHKIYGYCSPSHPRCPT